jgi:hypothetical protein
MASYEHWGEIPLVLFEASLGMSASKGNTSFCLQLPLRCLPS